VVTLPLCWVVWHEIIQMESRQGFRHCYSWHYQTSSQAVPILQESGWLQCLVFRDGGKRKFPLPEIHSVSNHVTDWAIPGQSMSLITSILSRRGWLEGNGLTLSTGLTCQSIKKTCRIWEHCQLCRYKQGRRRSLLTHWLNLLAQEFGI
jgi:hypothetical protein